MLGKLMKYEFKATGRVFLPLLIALLIVSAVNRLLSVIGLGAPFTIGAVVSGIMIASIFVLVIVLTIQRFRQNLLSNEGHLMMTLPVSTDSIILSKMFVASIWAVVSFLVVTLSIVIMAATGIGFSDIAAAFGRVFGELSGMALEVTLGVFEFIIFIALAVFSSALMLYACISLSMLVNKRRGLFTFGAFIVISTVMQTLASIIVTVGVTLEREYRWLTNLFDGFSPFGQSQIVVAAVLLVEAILCAAFFFITRYMLKNRLNLQ